MLGGDAQPHAEVLQAAEVIRSELRGRSEFRELVGTSAASLERELGVLLGDTRAAPGVVGRVVALLKRTEPTRRRLDELLRPSGEPDRARVALHRWRLAAPAASRFADVEWRACPRGDFAWPTFPGDLRSPRCPTHRLALVPEGTPPAD